MHRQLPLELQIMILLYLGDQDPLLGDSPNQAKAYPNWAHTLASCSLVCSAWTPICQKYLLRTSYLGSRCQMEGMTSGISATTKPLGSYVTQLRLFSLTWPDNRPFHHLVPLYLAKRLPFLRELRIDGSGTQTNGRKDVIFPITTQLTMHLSHFHYLIYLRLGNYHFQSFWDLRRFVVALPSLSILHLDHVTWPPFFEEVRVKGSPSLPCTACKLSRVSWVGCPPYYHELFWLWVKSSQSLAMGVRNVGCSEDRHPAFTKRDAIAMGQFSRYEWQSTQGSLRWSYDKQNRCYNFISDIPQYGQVLLMLESRIPDTPSGSKTHAISTQEMGTGRILSFIRTMEFHRGWGWMPLDEVCNRLHDLQTVQLNLRAPSNHEKPRDMIWSIIPLLPKIQARGNVSLIFTVNGECVPWKVLGDGPEN